MYKHLFLIASILMIFGCVTTPQKTLTKAGATQEDYSRDMLACRQYGMQSAQVNGLSGNMFVEVHIQLRVSECMRDLGWH